MFDKMDEHQKASLVGFATDMMDDAKQSSNDNSVMQLVFTMFDAHWLATYWRSIDDLMEDQWSIHINAIHSLGIGMVLEDMPNASNVIASNVLMNDGSVVELEYSFDEESDDEE